jgi:hypothetical protein
MNDHRDRLVLVLTAAVMVTGAVLFALALGVILGRHL